MFYKYKKLNDLFICIRVCVCVCMPIKIPNNPPIILHFLLSLFSPRVGFMLFLRERKEEWSSHFMRNCTNTPTHPLFSYHFLGAKPQDEKGEGTF